MISLLYVGAFLVGAVSTIIGGVSLVYVVCDLCDSYTFKESISRNKGVLFLTLALVCLTPIVVTFTYPFEPEKQKPYEDISYSYFEEEVAPRVRYSHKKEKFFISGEQGIGLNQHYLYYWDEEEETTHLYFRSFKDYKKYRKWLKENTPSPKDVSEVYSEEISEMREFLEGGQ